MDTEVYHFEVYGFYSGCVCVHVSVYLSILKSSKRFISTPHDYHMIAYRQSDVKFEFSDRSLE